MRTQTDEHVDWSFIVFAEAFLVALLDLICSLARVVKLYINLFEIFCTKMIFCLFYFKGFLLS